MFNRKAGLVITPRTLAGAGMRYGMMRGQRVQQRLQGLVVALKAGYNS